MKARWPWILVGLLTLVGLLFRLHQYGTSLFGDEMSTYLAVINPDRTIFDFVNSDAEISPPLYFMLAQITTLWGSAPELVRLPALVSGVACIPLIYLLGQRTVGRTPGLIAAGLMALSPFMIFFSGSGRAYTLMLALLIGSTLAMLAAARTGRTRWWVAYALLSALALYSHYTAFFILLAQFLWLLWAEPPVRVRVLIANLGAALLYLPWLPSLLKDTQSPTTDLLAALQGDGFEVKRQALEQWAFGHPLLSPAELPGNWVVIALVIALVVAVLACLTAFYRRRPSIGAWLREHRLAVLVFALALAAPVAETLLALVGTDLLGSRNLVASTPGLLLAIGTVLTAAGPVWGGICGVVVIGGFTIGAVKSQEDMAATPDYKSAAALIKDRAEQGDPVVDLISPPITPVSLTPLEAYIDKLDVFPLNLPSGEPPFLPLTPVPDPNVRLNNALGSARDRHVFIVGPRTRVTAGGADRGSYVDGNIVLPKGWGIDLVRTYPGLAELNVYEVSRRGGPAGETR